MRWRWRRPAPAPPSNVRVEYLDGRVVPLECAYLGRSREGIHTWAAVLIVAAADGMQVCCDRLPARTRIVVAAGPIEDW